MSEVGMDAMSQTFAIALLGNLYTGGSQQLEITVLGVRKISVVTVRFQVLELRVKACYEDFERSTESSILESKEMIL